MRHSFLETILPLSILDDRSRLRYLTADGSLRVSPFLEDLDMISGIIASEHLKQMYLRAGTVYSALQTSVKLRTQLIF